MLTHTRFRRGEIAKRNKEHGRICLIVISNKNGFLPSHIPDSDVDII